MKILRRRNVSVLRHESEHVVKPELLKLKLENTNSLNLPLISILFNIADTFFDLCSDSVP